MATCKMCGVIAAWPDGLPKMQPLVPEAKSGLFEIVHCRSANGRIYHGPGPFAALFMDIPPDGSNLHLERSRLFWMADVPEERDGHATLLRRARGRVLMAGLGIGMAALACAAKPEVESVTVLEFAEDVMGLVAEPLRRIDCWRRKVTLAHEDAREYTPTRGSFDTIWLDIWPTCQASFAKDYRRMLARYRPGLARHGYLSAWASGRVFHRAREAQ